MSEELKLSELTRALINARLSVRGTVYKGEQNRDQGYPYVSHENVLMGGARAALLDNGLCLEQTRTEFAGELRYPTRNGERPVWRWVGHFVLSHVSGEKRSYAFEGTTQPNDKAAFSASTSLDRVAHLRVLELAGSEAEDVEHDWHDDQRKRDEGEPVQRPVVKAQAAKVNGVTQLITDLKFVRDRDQLVSWAQYLAAEAATTEAKKPAWAAFGSRCEELKLDPREIAAMARRKS